MINKFIYKSSDSFISFINRNSIMSITLLIVFLFLAYLGVRIAGIFSIGPDTWGIMENNVIYSIQRMLAGHPLYQDPEIPPFGITQYSPVYYYIIYWFCKFANIPPDDILSIYFASRTVSLIFNLLFAFLIGKIASRFFNISIIESLLISMVAFIIIQRHGFSRPDSLYNVTILFTIYTYLLYLEKYDAKTKTSLSLLITGFVTALSLFSKQSGIIMIALLFFYQIAILKQIRDFIILSLALGVSSFLLFFVFSGPDSILFYKNTIRGLDNGIVLIWFWYNIVVDFFCTVNGFIFTLLILYSSIFLIRDYSNKHKFLGWSMLALFFFALLTGLKHGSTPSYFIEASALALIGFLIVRSHFILPAYIKILAITLGLLYFFMNPKILVPINKIERFNVTKFEKEKEVFDYISEYHKPGPDEWIFINTNGWESFLNGLFYEKGLFPHKDIIAQKQSFNYKSFDSIFAKDKVKIIITQSDSNNYLGNNFSKYKFIKNINGFKIYKNPNLERVLND